MIARPQIEGLDRVLAKFAKIKLGLKKIPTAVVYVKGKYRDGPDVGEVAAWHAEGAGPYPARNPFFLDRRQRANKLRLIRKGVLEIHRGLSSGMKQSMGDVGKQAALDIGRNLDRSLHAPLGEADPTPSKMAPLSSRYALYRRDRYGVRHKKPLKRTEKLRKGITWKLED